MVREARQRHYKRLRVRSLVSMDLRVHANQSTESTRKHDQTACDYIIKVANNPTDSYLTYSGGNNFSSSMVPRKPNSVLICSDVVLGDTFVTCTTFVV